jgi:hypothetical protein
MDHAILGKPAQSPATTIANSCIDPRKRMEEVARVRGFRKIYDTEVAYQYLILLSLLSTWRAQCGVCSELVHAARIRVPRILG